MKKNKKRDEAFERNICIGMVSFALIVVVFSLTTTQFFGRDTDLVNTQTFTAASQKAVEIHAVPSVEIGRADGFASATGFDITTTTGGADGQVVTVSNAADLKEYISKVGPYIIQVKGMIALPKGMHNVKSDKTIVGLGSTAGITGGGFNISSASNIIIKNLTFKDWSDDAINLQTFSHHVWIDHNDFSNGHDGAIDIKRGSDFVTISWNHFHDHNKTMLLGHDDRNAVQDLGHLRVTYHHNWFDQTVQRHPRVRFGDPVHIYNNYYLGNSGYGIASQMNAGVVVEGNYFENVKVPMRNDITSTPGRIVERDNVYIDSGKPFSFGTVTEPGTFYSYKLDKAQDIKDLVMAGAGAGKVGGSDTTTPTTPTTPTDTDEAVDKPTLSLSAGKATQSIGSFSVVLNWSSKNATTCSASDDWSGSQSVSGSKVISGLTKNVNFVLECGGTGGSVRKTVSVAAPIKTEVKLPVISLLKTSGITQDKVRIYWKTSKPTVSKVEYGTSASFGLTTLSTARTSSPDITISGLIPDTMYYYRVISTDEDGGVAVSSNERFETKPTVVVEPPVVSTSKVPMLRDMEVVNMANNSAVVTWSTDMQSSSVVDFGLTRSFGTTVTGVDSASFHAVFLSGLTPGTTYYVRARSATSAGEGITSPERFTTTSKPGEIRNLLHI